MTCIVPDRQILVESREFRNRLTHVNAVTPPRSRLAIEIVHDFVCPWCYLGVRRLMRALSARQSHGFDITWRPFLLNPDMPRMGMSRFDYVVRKFGGEERARRLYAAVTQLGNGEGLDFHFERVIHIPSSVDAHRLVGWAHRFGRATEMVEALFAAHFSDGRDIGDAATLVSIAVGIGLDELQAGAYLRSREGADIVHGENLRAHRLGISGVPCFVIGDRMAVSGAQEPEVFHRLLDIASIEMADYVIG
jgi:predicted DsbA family dithiol-disulfide isomerase